MLTHNRVFAPLIVNGIHNQTNNATNQKQQNQTADVGMSATPKQNGEKCQPNADCQTSTAPFHKRCARTTSCSRWSGCGRLRPSLDRLHAIASPGALPAAIELIFDILLTF
jgi:hypothetical protein